MRLRSFRPNKGAFLLEIMIAVSILAVSLLALYSGVTKDIIRGGNNNGRRTAKVLAQSKLSEIYLDQETGSEGEFDGYPGYTRKVEYGQVAIGDEAAIQLTLTVSFPLENEDGEERTEEAKIVSYRQAE